MNLKMNYEEFINIMGCLCMVKDVLDDNEPMRKELGKLIVKLYRIKEKDYYKFHSEEKKCATKKLKQ